MSRREPKYIIARTLLISMDMFKAIQDITKEMRTTEAWVIRDCIYRGLATYGKEIDNE